MVPKKRFEYLTIKEPDNLDIDGFHKWLDSLGNDLWELCGTIDRETYYIFKRAVYDS